MSELHYLERPATAGPPDGLLILSHGRGSDERDLIPLARVVDPDGRLQLITPRAPLRLPGSPGFHWYQVPRVGYPDPQTFRAARDRLAELHDELWARTGIGPERTILGGFSMGAVMSYTMGLDAERPPPAGVLALSGFIPTVEGWTPSIEDRRDLAIHIQHGTDDPVIGVEFARTARRRLEADGLQPEYREFPGGHHVDPRGLVEVSEWVRRVLAAG